MMRSSGALFSANRLIKQITTSAQQVVCFYENSTGATPRVVATVDSQEYDTQSLHINFHNSPLETRCFSELPADLQLQLAERIQGISLLFSGSLVVVDAGSWDWYSPKGTAEASKQDIYQQLVRFLQDQSIAFREVSHEEEGRCDLISKIRGNELRQAMKALVLMASPSKTKRHYYLAVVPGDKNIDMEAIKQHIGIAKLSMAPREKVSELTGCVIGAVPPFSFNSELKLLVDPSIQENNEIVFNAGRLDCSFFMNTADYVQVTNPDFVNMAVVPQPVMNETNTPPANSNSK